MTKVLITGATGNVGIEVLEALKKLNPNLEIYAGVRNIASENKKLENFNIKTVQFDFTDINTFLPALKDKDIIFLLRPPQISNVKKYFAPLIKTIKKTSIKHIIFLSVQGVENSTIIPHHKIEQLIVRSNISFTFLRPAYFMQNFTSSLQSDLLHKSRIFLPAGKAKFTVIDTKDIGLVAAKIIAKPQDHINKAYDLTNNEILTFAEMAQKISKGIKKNIQYVSPSLLNFFLTKRKEKTPVMLILVMIMLHYFPRFQKTPKTTKWVKIITGQEPNSFEDFVESNFKQQE